MNPRDLRQPAWLFTQRRLLQSREEVLLTRLFPPAGYRVCARQIEPGAPTVCFAQYHPRARQRHRHTIRTFYGFRACDSAASRLLLKEIAGLVRSQVKPKVLFWRCIDV